MAFFETEGGGNTLLGGLATEVSGRTSSKLAWSRTKRMMQNKYQWQRADMEKAGINPLLGAFQLTGMGSVNAMPPVDHQKGVSNVLQGKRLSQEKDLQTSVILRNAAEAEAARERGVHSAASAKQAGIQTELLELDLARATNVSQLETEWPAIQKIERVLRVIGPLIAAGAGGMLGGKALRSLFKRHSKELKRMRALRDRSHNVPSAVRGSGRVPTNKEKWASGKQLFPTPNPKRSANFEDF